MDPLSKLGRTLAIVRRVAAGRQSETKKSAPLSGTASPPQEASEAAFRALVAQRLRTIDPRAPGFRKTTVTVFVEQVLLREFGQEMLNSRHFQDTVQQVQRLMEADAGTKAELNKLIDELMTPRPV